MEKKVESAVVWYATRARTEGPSEDDFFGIIDFGLEAVDTLLTEVVRPENRPICAFLAHCLWQLRSREQRVYDVLTELALDNETGVWREALDGLVTLGGAQAAAKLRAITEELTRRGLGSSNRADWVAEALTQVSKI